MCEDNPGQEVTSAGDGREAAQETSQLEVDLSRGGTRLFQKPTRLIVSALGSPFVCWRALTHLYTYVTDVLYFGAYAEDLILSQSKREQECGDHPVADEGSSNPWFIQTHKLLINEHNFVESVMFRLGAGLFCPGIHICWSAVLLLRRLHLIGW